MFRIDFDGSIEICDGFTVRFLLYSLAAAIMIGLGDDLAAPPISVMSSGNLKVL